MSNRFSISNVSDRLKATAADGYQAIELDETLCQTLSGIKSDVPDALRVRPPKENDAIEAGQGMLDALHTVDETRFRHKNVSPAHAFEVDYNDRKGQINIQFVPGTDETFGDLETHINDQYPNAITERTDPDFLEFEPGRYVAGAEMELDRYTLYLIKHADLEGFRRDPYGGITSEMVREGDGPTVPFDVVSQVVFRPEPDGWEHGVNGGPGIHDLAHELRQPNIEYRRKTFTKERIENPPSKKEKKAADIIEGLSGESGWNINLRIFAVADDPDAAAFRARKVADKFRNFYESSTKQRFEPVPLRGDDLRGSLRRAVGREWEDRGMVKSESETAGLVHAMNDEINTQKFDWALAKPGEGQPPGTADYDFDAAGVAGGSDEEKQLAMVDSPEYGDPAYWFGYDQKSGDEAGVYERFMNAHMQITGATRMGKTTLATNFASQVMKRDRGALIIALGKDNDDEEFVAEWPEDRPEDDFVFIDTGDQFQQMVRFNLLEVPDRLEPGTAAHTSYIESLADDFSAAFAQAGGDDSLYPLMRGITRTTVRGMAMSGKTCTPVDLAAACSSAENMGKFSQWMDEERIHFIRETVERFKEKEDADFEPIARRMDEIVHNGTLRRLLSARDPTVRIQDLVDQDKVVVLRLDDALGETEQTFVTTPIVRRFAHAKKVSDNETPFHVLWDEADKAATSQSNLAEMLSVMGGYGMRFTLIYQAPSHQLPDDLRDATESQINTTISFRTRGDDARFISRLHTVDAEDLTHLPRFSFYMWTDTDNNEPSDSYMVNAFPPVREVRQQVAGIEPRSPDQITAMKRRSVERYGDEVESAEEVKAQSPFFDRDDDSEDDEKTLLIRATTLRAIYDGGYYSIDPNGFVPLSDVGDRIRRYLDQADLDVAADTASQIEGLLGQIPERFLQRDHRDGDLYLRCTDEGKMRFLTPIEDGSDKINENVGGMAHAELMRDAYDDFLDLDLPMRVCHQDGGALPDGIALPDDEKLHSARSNPTLEAAEVAELVAEFRENNDLLDRLTDAKPVAIEAEHSTGDSAPAQTLINIRQAVVDNNQRCMLLARPETADLIAERIDDYPKCMRSFSGESGAHRLYNANGDLRPGANNKAVYRRSGGESVWLYLEDRDAVELRDSNGKPLATFENPEDVFEDASAYPRTEDEISDYSEWTAVKPPVIPTVAFGDDGLDRDMIDVIEVTDSGPLKVVEDGGETRIPIADVLDQAGDGSASGALMDL